jgi:hypothetical protein
MKGKIERFTFMRISDVDCNPVGLFTNFFKFGLLTHGLLIQIGNP